MNILFPVPKPAGPVDTIQGRLLRLAALFLAFYALILTFSPIVRLHAFTAELRWEHWIGGITWLAAFALLHRQTQRTLPDRDPYLLPLAGLLSGWGLLTIFRLSTNFGLRQATWLAVASLVVYFGLRIPDLLGLVRRYKYLLLTAGLLLLGLTFFLGSYPQGAGPRLWLGCCGVYFQPSEPLKLLLVAYLAAYLADRLPLSFNLLRLVLPTLVMTGVALALLVAQRDLGTASLFIILYTSVLYIASHRKRIFWISLVVLAAAGIIGYQMFAVVRLRIDTWINPWLDPSGASFQIVQSLISVASGGIFGSGPGLGSPGLVPVAQSDFIYAAISEETGLLGSAGLILAIALLSLRSLWIALRASDLFERYLAVGLGIYLGVQSILIIGGTVRLFPLTGVTLPFVSYGGSSLLTVFISLLLLLKISNQAETEPAPLARAQPYTRLGGLLMAGFFLIALASGNSAVIQSTSLTGRDDNPRRWIEDRYVRRGAILDRSSTPLSTTIGSSGNYTRNIAYPLLSPIIGYTQAGFGQSALEASLDPFLRGLLVYPALDIYINQIIYNQPPPGLDVRLSISLALQKKADQLLAGHTGAVVMLNAHTGEILVMATYPSFDANTLTQNWSTLLNDPHAPLLNRAAQGQYLPGTILGAFLLADSYRLAVLPDIPSDPSYTLGTNQTLCALPVTAPYSWPALVSNGCPGGQVALGEHEDTDSLTRLYEHLGFFTAPEINLPVAVPPLEVQAKNIDSYILGQDILSVSPIQMATAAAALSNNGQRPVPRLVLSVRIPQQGWITLPTQLEPVAAYSASYATQAARALSLPDLQIWQSLGQAFNGATPTNTWYIGGTLPEWQGIPMAVAVLVEENNPALVTAIGQGLLNAATNP